MRPQLVIDGSPIVERVVELLDAGIGTRRWLITASRRGHVERLMGAKRIGAIAFAHSRGEPLPAITNGIEVTLSTDQKAVTYYRRRSQGKFVKRIDAH